MIAFLELGLTIQYRYFGSCEENEVAGFVISSDFFLFIAPAGGSNPAGQSLNLT